MAQATKTEQGFEEAIEKITLATWNRPRTNEELRSFVSSHHDELVDVELGL